MALLNLSVNVKISPSPFNAIRVLIEMEFYQFCAGHLSVLSSHKETNKVIQHTE